MADQFPDGATPIDADEAAELLPQHLQTRPDLNEWEQVNILAAQQWARRSRIPAISEQMVRELHRRMFDQTWRWAGSYRKSNKNLGVHWSTIAVEVRNLVDDAEYWVNHTVFDIDEIALRLHHRLVLIHPFVNGNGRHARLWCDTVLMQFDQRPFTWPADSSASKGGRGNYIRALQAADDQDYQPLRDLLLRDRT